MHNRILDYLRNKREMNKLNNKRKNIKENRKKESQSYGANLSHMLHMIECTVRLTDNTKLRWI